MTSVIPGRARSARTRNPIHFSCWIPDSRASKSALADLDIDDCRSRVNPRSVRGFRNDTQCRRHSPLLRAAGERVLLLAQGDADRHAWQIEGLTQAVDEIAQIGVRHRIGPGAEEHEAR